MTHPIPRKLSLRIDYLQEKGIDVQESSFRMNDIKFEPKPFMVGGPNSRMVEKKFSKEAQDISLQGFLNNPHQPVVYGVSSQSNHHLSLFFTAFLVQEFLRLTHGSNKVTWLRGYQLAKDNVVPESTRLLVLTGLTPNSSKYTLEQVANKLDRFDHIPRIVCLTGADPITFFATSLYYKVDRIFFHTDRTVNREVEVV